MKKIKSIKNLQFKKDVISSLNLGSTIGGAVGSNTETIPARVCNSVDPFCPTANTCVTNCGECC